MDQYNAFNGSHPRSIPDSSQQRACVENAVRPILANFILHRYQRLKLCNLN